MQGYKRNAQSADHPMAQIKTAVVTIDNPAALITLASPNPAVARCLCL